jgi:hypothetical protein
MKSKWFSPFRLSGKNEMFKRPVTVERSLPEPVNRIKVIAKWIFWVSAVGIAIEIFTIVTVLIVDYVKLHHQGLP